MLAEYGGEDADDVGAQAHARIEALAQARSRASSSASRHFPIAW